MSYLVDAVPRFGRGQFFTLSPDVAIQVRK